MVVKRVQLPIKVCYVMTINKAQGQTLQQAVIDLRSPVFTHGQLYVALSRVGDPTAIKVMTAAEHGPYTANVVYPELIE